MGLSNKVVGKLRSSGAGEAAFRVVRDCVHAGRRLRYPQLPPHEQLSTVRCCGQEIQFRHRRTYADQQILEQCFIDEQYRMPNGAHGALLEQAYERMLADGRTPLIVDCGANIGASVVWFAHRFPRAQVVAVEPAADNFALLRHNTASLNVDLRQAGIAASDGWAVLTDPKEGPWAYRTREAGGSGEGMADPIADPRVEMVGLEGLLRSKVAEGCSPLLLKVDIEGAEAGLFAGDTSMVNSFPVILMEPHDWMLPGQRSSGSFFRFHAAAGREFCMRAENVASIAWDRSLLEYRGKLAQ